MKYRKDNVGENINVLNLMNAIVLRFFHDLIEKYTDRRNSIPKQDRIEFFSVPLCENSQIAWNCNCQEMQIHVNLLLEEDAYLYGSLYFGIAFRVFFQPPIFSWKYQRWLFTWPCINDPSSYSENNFARRLIMYIYLSTYIHRFISLSWYLSICRMWIYIYESCWALFPTLNLFYVFRPLYFPLLFG